MRKCVAEGKEPGLLVAIDGPSGSGKSTVSKRLAHRLELDYLDTGAMYRAVTLLALRSGADLDDAGQIVRLADEMDFRSVGTLDRPRFFLGVEEVTDDLRRHEVAQNVSLVARHPEVRRWMAEEQAEIMGEARCDGRGMVAEGRDITTVVCPDADVRVLLTADPEARLHRRTMEVHGEVTPELLEQMQVVVSGRDVQDSVVSEFLEPAPGVVQVDSSHMTIEETVDQIALLGEAILQGREEAASQED